MQSENLSASRKTFLKPVVLVIAVLIAVALGFWAGRVTLEPRSAVQAGKDATVALASVTTATVGRQLNLSATVEQDPRTIAHNMLTGVVTSATPGRHAAGDVIYTVGNTAVRVVQGSTPFFRDLKVGDQGQDVKQLTTYLASEKLLPTTTNFFSARVKAAIDELHRRDHEPWSETAALGSFVAVPNLPSQIMLGSELTTAGLVNPGTGAISVPAAGKKFILRLSPDQARLIPTGSPVAISYEDKTWQAVTEGAVESADQTYTVIPLTATSGRKFVCDPDCGRLPAAASLTLPSRITITKPATGPAVPAAAILTDAAGQTYVTLEGGRQVKVAIQSTGGGLAVVSGVQVGQRVQVAALPQQGG